MKKSLRRSEIGQDYLSFTRLTNFNPDQTSETAQTFTSTSPDASPISRTTFSVTSVFTPELFFGQLTHSIPAGARRWPTGQNFFSNSSFDLAKIMAKSSAFFPGADAFVRPPGLGPGICREAISHPASAAFNSSMTSDGASTSNTRTPSLMPSFLASGVPEYPGKLFLGSRHAPHEL